MALKKISLVLAAVLMAGCISCGDSGDDNGTSGKSTAKSNKAEKAVVFSSSDSDFSEGKYATVWPYTGKRAIYDDDVDKGFKEALKSEKNISMPSLEFDDGEFTMRGDMENNIEFAAYKGSYSVDDGEIKFSYENFHGENYDVSIDEKLPDYDKEIVETSNPYKAKSLEGLPMDEKKKRVKEERLIYSRHTMQNKMKRWNETGSYYNNVAPRMMFSDKVAAYNAFPIFTMNVKGVQQREDSAFVLHSVDDFICVPTYGFELDGDYDKGDDFSITYNILDTMKDDPYSIYNLDKWESTQMKEDATYAEYYERIIEKQIGDLKDTRIEFSNGKWTWTNSKGELINNGTYLESDDHEGFIAMFVVDDSKNNDKDYQQLSPLYFYIDGDGTIWYPNWIKMD